MSLAVVILAAGQGVRMNSPLPKMLHCIAGKPLLAHIISTAKQLNPAQIIVVCGHKSEELKTAFLDCPEITWVEQRERLGTGHAVLQVLERLNADNVLIWYGDIPLMTQGTLTNLLESTPPEGIGLVTTCLADPTGLGRIVRDTQGKIVKIVEEKDATADEKKITEINTGFFLIPSHYLAEWLPQLSANNAQKEYYLPEVVALAKQQEIEIAASAPQFEWEIMGVNDQIQRAALERAYQQAEAHRLMRQGVTILDPARLDLRGAITVGQSVVLDVNVILEGEVTLGDRVKIGPNVWIKNSSIQNGAEILANSVIEGALIGSDCVVGPFARVRPGTRLESKAKVGNFVEIKNAVIGSHSKVNHLSYVGDANVGQNVNIGAGVITCNFDGKNKHKTVIGDFASIGANSQLIAPVTIGEGATIGAGTTVTRDVSPQSLVHHRVERRVVAEWKKKDKEP